MVIFPLFVRNDILSSIEFLTNMYEQNGRTADNRQIFADFTKLLKLFVKFLIVDYSLCIVAYHVSPVVVHYFGAQSEWKTMLPWFLPGTSPETNSNSWLSYWLNMCYQSPAVLMGGIAYAFFDVLLAVLILHTILLTNILRTKVQTIDEKISTAEWRPLEIYLNFRNLILLHDEMLK